MTDDLDDPQNVSAAVHEAGHAVVAKHYGLSDGQRAYISKGNGVALHRSGTDFQNCVIGLAGVIAEELADLRNPARKLPGFALTEESVERWATAAFRDAEKIFSKEDRHELIYSTVSPVVAVRAAVSILRPRMVEVLHLANRLLGRAGRGEEPGEVQVANFVRACQEQNLREHQEQNAAWLDAELQKPWPSKWPADADDFLFAVVARREPVTPEAAKRFADYCVHLKHAGGHADFQSSTFDTMHEWRCAVTRYQSWLETQAPQPKEQKI